MGERQSQDSATAIGYSVGVANERRAGRLRPGQTTRSSATSLVSGASQVRTFKNGIYGGVMFESQPPRTASRGRRHPDGLRQRQRQSKQGRLFVLDAQTLDDVASVEPPARVPIGFPGN